MRKSIIKYLRRSIVSCKVDNAIIMAAGLSSRFAPISYEKPKALINVKGEVLIERQICQIREAGIDEIILVVGYKKEQFEYLEKKYGIRIVENTQYMNRNNNSSIYAVKEYLKNSYICSADNYFSINPFENEVDDSYYSALYAEGYTNEWCISTDEKGWITDVKVGGHDSWYMLGHVFWSQEFSDKFLKILENIYDEEETKDKLWEAIYMENIDELKMKIRMYDNNDIYEFDSLDELRMFDENYKNDSGSDIMRQVANELECDEIEITTMVPMKDASGEVIGFSFNYNNETYNYDYESKEIVKKGNSNERR